MRDRLIELLQNFADGTYASNGRFVDNTKVDDVADYLLANGVTVQEWISVKDRLPEECPHPYDDMTKAVLIYTPVDGYTHIGWYAGKDWRGRDEWKTLSAMRSYQTCIKKVSHWCYLPQPPKGETIYCKDCEYLMFSDCYGECANGHKGIVNPNDTCEHAKRKPPKGE